MITEHGVKPRLRGMIHQVAFIVSIPAGAALIAMARTGTARIAAAVYAFAAIGLYGASSAYHRIRWSPRARLRMRRLDHSMIYVLIAGTYTPICLLALHGVWRWGLLGVAWAGALVGVAVKATSIDRYRRFGGASYIILGWLAIVALPEIARSLSIPALSLMVVGGVLYTGGAVVLARGRPDPSPAVFGFHEVWHAIGVTAGACHYVMVALLVTSG